MKLNILVRGVRHYCIIICMFGLFAIPWFPVSCSPAQFQSSRTSWQTSLLLRECGAPSALCMMPVGNNLRLPIHLMSIERAHIWSALHATLLMIQSNNLGVHRTSDDVHHHAAKAGCCSTKTRYNNVMVSRKLMVLMLHIWLKRYLGWNTREGSTTTLPGVRHSSDYQDDIT